MIGEEFEVWAWGLLARHYPATQLVRIPAGMGGDYGLEGYSRDGVAYQCYADQDSVGRRDRTDKQKAKLRRDTAKLKDNSTAIEAVLGDVKLHAYVLIVPEYHAAELVTYAQKRSADIRGWNLPFIADDFFIFVKTPSDYPAAFVSAMADGAAEAQISEPRVPVKDIDEFPGDRPDLVRTLDEKLDVLKGLTGADPVTLRAKFIEWYLARERILGQVHREWPHLWESIEGARQLREDRLELESELASSGAGQRLTSLLADYQEQLVAIRGLRPADAQRLAYGQAADWLMRCPLRFRT